MPYAAYDMLAWGGGRRGGTYRPGPSSSHGFCFLILCPAGWFVLHRHSVEPLSSSLSLAHCAAANVSGDRLVRAKIGTASGAWAALIAPTAHKVMESDG
jgi:hypothetical protein